VPVDHAHPERGTISIEVARRNAESPAKRIGTIVFLPGGPGDDGTVQVSAFSQAVRDRFDVVSYNPRGFSPGTEIDCGFDEPEPAANPVSDEAMRAYVARRSRACAANGGPLLGHVSAVDVARDVDVLRRSLGEEKVSLFGVSYGTAVGSIYQTLFPDHVRVAVHDAAFDLSSDPARRRLGYAAAERSLDELLRRCARRPSCAFHSGGNPRAALVRLLDRLEAVPQTVKGRTYTVFDAEQAIVSWVTFESGWAPLEAALAAAQAGDVAPLADLGQFSVASPDSGIAAVCADRPASDLRLTPAEVGSLRRIAPLLARHHTPALWSVGACDGWPVQPTLPPKIARASAPTLVVGGTGDTRTPLEMSRELARELGAPMLVVRQFAHTAYSGRDYPEPTCVTRVVDAALLELRLPRDGTVCAGDPVLGPVG
jgi:pimeloyl-ACP methyl ester carboxylesterase